MNKNDLSDESNPWRLFSDTQLVHIGGSLGGSVGEGDKTKPCPACLEFKKQIKAELERRRKAK